MLRLRDLTIRQKLIMITMIPIVVVTVLGIAAFVLWAQIDSRRNLVTDLFSSAEMLSDNCKASLAFKNKQDAEQILSSLRAHHSAVLARIYDTQGQVFAEYKRDGIAVTDKILPPGDGSHSVVFENGRVSICEEIVLDDEVVGVIQLIDDLSRQRHELRCNTVVGMAILAIALVAGCLFASLLQRVISGPILDLAEIASEVSEKNDYSIRAPEKSKDEVGYFTHVFNTMLEQIQQRDKDLSDARDKLETRVRERTAELTCANEQLTREVDERMKAEDQVRQKNEFLNTILESLTHPFYVIDAKDYTIKVANSAARHLCHDTWSAGMTCHMLSHMRDKPCKTAEDPCPIEEIKKTGKPAVVEHLHYDQDHNPQHVEVHAYPIYDETGELSEIIEYSLDITDRKRAEAELHTTQEKLIETAHQAGMAEVAADVLHNVGNVLNSVNVSTTLITEKITRWELPDLEEVARIVNEHIDEIGTFLTEHPRGKHIPVYLTEISRCLQTEQADIIDKLHVLADNVQHIKDIISMQQAYAKVSGVSVQVSPSQLAEDAIQINSAGLQRHGTRLIREFEELPDVEIDKQRVLQILVNLISNAKYALSDSKKREKLVTIRIYKHNKDRFRIEVTDNGVGIPEENLMKVFSHGFTTKEGGHGFGLHGSALAASQMGGSLQVHSNGVEQGATFTLELPFKPAKVVS